MRDTSFDHTVNEALILACDGNERRIAELYQEWVRASRPLDECLAPPELLDAAAGLARSQIPDPWFGTWVTLSLDHQLQRQRRLARRLAFGLGVVGVALVSFAGWGTNEYRQVVRASGDDSAKISRLTEQVTTLDADLGKGQQLLTAAKAEADRWQVAQKKTADQLAGIEVDSAECKAAALLGSSFVQRGGDAQRALAPELATLDVIERLPPAGRAPAVAALLETFPLRFEPPADSSGYALVQADLCAGDLLFVRDRSNVVRFWDYGTTCRTERDAWRLDRPLLGCGLDPKHRWLAIVEPTKDEKHALRVRDLAAPNGTPADQVVELDTFGRLGTKNTVSGVVLACDHVVVANEQGTLGAFRIVVQDGAPGFVLQAERRPSPDGLGALLNRRSFGECTAISPDGRSLLLIGATATAVVDLGSNVAGVILRPTTSHGAAFAGRGDFLALGNNLVPSQRPSAGVAAQVEIYARDDRDDPSGLWSSSPQRLEIEQPIEQVEAFGDRGLLVRTADNVVALALSGHAWKQIWSRRLAQFAAGYQLHQRGDAPIAVTAICPRPGGEQFLVLRSDGSAILCSTADGSLVQWFGRGHAGMLVQPAFAPDGRRFVAMDLANHIVRTFAIEIGDSEINYFAMNPQHLIGRK